MPEFEDRHAMVDRLFTYHPPTPEQQPIFAELREKFNELGHLIVEKTPPSPEQTIALRQLHVASMLTNAAIACNPT